MISIDRAKQIINCYGGYPLTWPEQDRQAMQQLLLDCESLRDCQEEALSFDDFMGFIPPKSQDSFIRQSDKLCAERIVDSLPVQEKLVEPALSSLADKPSLANKNSSKISRFVLLAASVVLGTAVISSNMFQLNKSQARDELSLSDYLAIYVNENAEIDNESSEITDELEVLAYLEPQFLEEM
jgi:hypothetical protein